MKEIINLFKLSKETDYKTEILSGITVALALVPEAIAFAMIAGFSPLTGLYAAFMIGLVASLLGGRPGMISGATGAIAVIFIGLITELRILFPDINNTGILQYVFATVILAGIFQILAGIFKLGKFIRLVPHSVMFGFVNGLAIIIFLAQLPTITHVIESHPALSSLLSFEGSFSFSELTPGLQELGIMIGLILLTMLIIWKLPSLTTKIPASLVAILIVSAITIGLGLSTTTVADTLSEGESLKATFPPLTIPQIPLSWDTLMLIMPFSIIMAGVGLIESLLTLNLIDEITESRGNSNKECIAQGTANIFSGQFSGMGGCAMIGQSLINISSGARTRIAGFVASVMLLVFIMFGSGFIERLPMPALVGVMFMVSIGTFEWASLRIFNKMPLSDVLVMVLVTAITVITHNLAVAVLTGVILSALFYAWENAKRIRTRKYIDAYGIKHYEIYGPLFFASTNVFMDKFDIAGDPKEVIIDFKESRIVDMSAIETLNTLTMRYSNAGKTIHLKHLSEDCKRLLNNADALIDVNVLEDPTYKVVTDKMNLVERN
ncbi:MAG: sodium-independent anion transporter [Bacteroidia bacterium 44-10]|nr:MAG: sodium-independent anion transporter [Bacteroidia bacterium 44-10]